MGVFVRSVMLEDNSFKHLSMLIMVGNFTKWSKYILIQCKRERKEVSLTVGVVVRVVRFNVSGRGYDLSLGHFNLYEHLFLTSVVLSLHVCKEVRIKYLFLSSLLNICLYNSPYRILYKKPSGPVAIVDKLLCLSLLMTDKPQAHSEAAWWIIEQYIIYKL